MLYDTIKKLTKHSVIYALGPAVHKGVGFLIIPLVTVWIGSRENYGVFELASMTLLIAGQLLGMNLLSGMTRYYWDYDEKRRGELVITTLVLLLTSTGVAFGLAVVFQKEIAIPIFGSAEYAPVVVVASGILFCQTMGMVGLRYLQVLQRSVTYGLLTTFKLLTEVGLKFLLMGALGMTYMGMLYSVLVGEALLALGTIVWLFKAIGPRVSGAMARRLLRFSYPLILSGLCLFALHQFDRYVIRLFHGLGETGRYGLAYKFGSIVNLIVLEAFGMIWFPYIFSLKDDEQVRLICRKILTYFSVLVIGLSLVIAVFSREIVELMTDSEFWGIENAIPLILLGYVFWAIYSMVQTNFYLKEKTGQLSVLVLVAALLNLGLNFLLVPGMGYMGSACSMATTFGFLCVLGWILSERVQRTEFEIGRVLTPLLLALGLFFASRAIPTEDPIPSYAGKGLLLLVYPAALFFGGYLKTEEKARLVHVVGAIFRKKR